MSSWRSFRLPGGITVIAVVLSGVWTVAAQEPSTSQSSITTGEPRSYMRVRRPVSNEVHLQIALRKFTSDTNPVVWLSSVSHLGETNYFEMIQRHLNAQEIVLFEGVKAHAGDTPFPDKTGKDDEAPSLQSTLAQSLGLAFQLEAIDYTRPNFRHSDLSLAKLMRLMSAETNVVAAGQAGGAEFQALLEVMDGNSMLGAIAGFGARLLGSSPKLRGFTRLLLIETVGQLEGDLAQMAGMPPELQRLMNVIISARNETVIDDIKKLIRGSAPPKSIAVLYGAAHMADLEKRLTRELNYRPVEDVWLTAITVDLAEAGLTAAEVDLVRSTVQWQLNMLRAPGGAGVKD